MASNISIRKATLDDLDVIIEELKNFSDFIGTKKKIFNGEPDSIEKIKDLIVNHYFIVADHAISGVVGFICAMLMPHPMNGSIVIFSELFWWVKEKFRLGRAGLLLLNEAVEYAKSKADFITFSLESKSNINEKSLIKRGFKSFERTFLLEVN